MTKPAPIRILAKSIATLRAERRCIVCERPLPAAPASASVCSMACRDEYRRVVTLMSC
jgi:predicted nucleic acid-binding Zn ribbon protein